MVNIRYDIYWTMLDIVTSYYKKLEEYGRIHEHPFFVIDAEYNSSINDELYYKIRSDIILEMKLK